MAGDWVVEPADLSGGFRFRIGPPQGFERNLLTTDGAPPAPGGRADSIPTYCHGTPYRLQFPLEVRDSSFEEHEVPALRSERIERALAIAPAALALEGRGGGEARSAGTASP